MNKTLPKSWIHVPILHDPQPHYKILHGTKLVSLPQPFQTHPTLSLKSNSGIIRPILD